MPTLRACLEAATYRRLWTIAQAHSFSAPRRHPTKAEWVDALHAYLATPETVQRLWSRLTPRERIALAALVGNPLPTLRQPFASRFGAVRPHRPWDKTQPGPDRPWFFPANPTERLWYLGLIYTTPRHADRAPRLCVPDELRALLAPLLLTEAAVDVEMPQAAEAGQPGDLPPAVHATLHDIAVLLGLLQYHDVPLAYGRWLPPTLLTLFDRLSSEPQDPTPTGEMRAPRLRFIHYLIVVLNLVTVQHGYLKPTAAAHLWLRSDPVIRLQTLWARWLQPVRWRDFRLPGLPWADPIVGIESVLARLRFASADAWLADTALAGEDLPAGDLARLLVGPLTWLGLVETAYVQQTEPMPDEARPLAARLTKIAREPASAPLPPRMAAFDLIAHDDRVEIAPPPDADLYPLFQALALSGGWSLTPESVGHAIDRGYTLDDIMRVVSDLAQRPLTADEYAMLKGWGQRHPRFRLRRVTLLEADDPTTLGDFAARRVVRPLLRQTIGPRAVVVDHAQTRRLLNLLHRLNADVEAAVSPVEIETALDLRAAEPTLFAAALVYQALGRYVDLPLKLPAALLERLASALSAEQRADVAALAEDTLARLQHVFDGYSDPPYDAPLAAAAPDTAARLTAAAREGRPVTLTYWTAGRGVLTRRTVDPYRLETRGGVLYLVGYCHTRQAERVFRLDRIREIVDL